MIIRRNYFNLSLIQEWISSFMIGKKEERSMDTKEKKSLRTFGLVLYMLGALVGFLLLTMSVWGDVEASTFGAALKSDESLNTLSCPVFIAKDEVGVISAVIENGTDRDASPMVRSRITSGFVTLVDEQNLTVDIPAGGAQEITWNVSMDNAAYGRLILARFYQFSNFSIPSRQGFCGIVVLPFTGVTGQQVFVGGFVLSMLLVAAGISLFTPKNILRVDNMNAQNKRLRSIIRSFIFLGTYFLVATLLSLTGDLLLGVALMLLAVVSAISVFAFALSSN